MMEQALKKLQFKGQSPALVMNAPSELAGMIRGADASIKGTYAFILAFVPDKSALERIIKDVVRAADAKGYLWICYPKGTSKKYTSDVNRDKLRELLGRWELEAVTLVSIDDDWSALRFRRVEEIKTMKRASASSSKGRERIKRNPA